MSDESFLEDWRRGGEDREQAFRALYNRYAPELAGTFHNTMGLPEETCPDLVQETLLQVSRSLDNFRSDASLRTWIHKIGRSTVLHHLRKKKAAKRKADVISLDADRSPGEESTTPLTVPDTAPGVQRTVEAKNRLRDVRRAIEDLPNGERRIFLFSLQGQSIGAISRLANKPKGTVKSTVHRVRRKLERELKAIGWDLPRLEEEQQ